MDKPIYSPSSEQAALAFTLRHPEEFCNLYSILKPENFYWKPFGWAWAAMQRLNSQGCGIDLVTVSDELEREKQLTDFCLPVEQLENLDKAVQFHGFPALSQLRDIQTTGNGTDYAYSIQDYYIKRKIIPILSEAAEWTQNGHRSKDIVSDLQERLEKLNICEREERGTSVSSTADEVELEARERAKNPCDVWGIPYAWPYLSILTGGKQPGELTILAGEPKVGKTWLVMQDALETAMKGIPVYYWSGEMRKKQLTRRFISMLGVDSRRMRNGNMRNEDWDALEAAKTTLQGIPLYLDDTSLSLGEIRGVLTREKSSHGIQQAILDYSLLVQDAGINEIERSGNVSREMKVICNELELAGVLIASVNKGGFDTTSETVTKSNVRGSGQQIHDADNVFLLTKFAKTSDPDEIYIQPDRWDYIVSLHVAAARDMDFHIPGGVLHYERIEGTPKFKELKEVSTLPSWIAGKEKVIDKMKEQDL
jgi:replicative DNA helicase